MKVVDEQELVFVHQQLRALWQALNTLREEFDAAMREGDEDDGEDVRGF